MCAKNAVTYGLLKLSHLKLKWRNVKIANLLTEKERLLSLKLYGWSVVTIPTSKSKKITTETRVAIPKNINSNRQNRKWTRSPMNTFQTDTRIHTIKNIRLHLYSYFGVVNDKDNDFNEELTLLNNLETYVVIH